MSDDNHQGVVNQLQQQITAMRKQLEEATTKVSNFEGIDLSKAKEAIQFQAESKRKQLESAGNYAKALQAEKEKFTEQINQGKEQIKNLNSQLSDTLLNNVISAAIGKVGGQLRPLAALIQSESLVRVISEGGKLVARVFNKGSDTPRTLPDSTEPMCVDDLVCELEADKELAGLFPSSGNSGGGAPPSSTPTAPSKSIKGFKGNLTEFAKSVKTKIGV